MNEFTTIFEKTAGGYLASALFHFVIGAGLIIWGITGIIRNIRSREKMGWYLILVVPGIFWLIIHMNLFLFVTFDMKGKPRVAEGVVQVAGMQAYHGHNSGDRITVGGRPFVVDYFLLTPGYNQTIARGGALQAGVYARLHHYNGLIVKVEVRKKDAGRHGP